jgi:chromate transporter
VTEPLAKEVTRAGLSPRLDVFLTALRLGCTSFGGPIAHLGYFRSEYVHRRRWVSEETYADLVALCQFLPGPASSQVGIGIGTIRAGKIGGLLAWTGFTLPSFLLMALFAGIVNRFDITDAGWVHGLNVVAVAVVALAVTGMARQFCRDSLRIGLAVAAAIVVLLIPTASAQIGVLLIGAIVGWRFIQSAVRPAIRHERSPISRRFGISCLVLLGFILISLRLGAREHPDGAVGLTSMMFDAGSLVFGGGHIILPLLQRQVVPAGWMSDATFISGYGAAQAVPGPLFSFSAFIGSARNPEPNGLPGALLATVAIFLPSILLIFGGLPFWDQLRASSLFRGTLAGINATVVGILAAAFIDPVWTTAILRVSDLALAALCLVLLAVRKWPPWVVVIFAAGMGEILSRLL